METQVIMTVGKQVLMLYEIRFKISSSSLLLFSLSLQTASIINNKKSKTKHIHLDSSGNIARIKMVIENPLAI